MKEKDKLFVEFLPSIHSLPLASLPPLFSLALFALSGPIKIRERERDEGDSLRE